MIATASSTFILVALGVPMNLNYNIYCFCYFVTCTFICDNGRGDTWVYTERVLIDNNSIYGLLSQLSDHEGYAIAFMINDDIIENPYY